MKVALVNHNYYQQTLGEKEIALVCDMLLSLRWVSPGFPVRCSLFDSQPGLVAQKQQACPQQWAELFGHLLQGRIGELGKGLDEALASRASLMTRSS